MATYNDLVTMVRDWANRDSSVLPDSVIQSSLRYAADEAYRSLEIPPLEFTKYFITRKDTALTYCTKTSDGVYSVVTSNNIKDAVIDSNDVNPHSVETASFTIPHDTISFIYLRTSGITKRPEVGSTVGSTTITEDNQENYVVINTNDTPQVTSHNYHTNTVYNEKVNSRLFYDFSDGGNLENYFTRRGTKVLVAGQIEQGYVYELFYYRRLAALNARYSLPDDLTLAQAQADTETYEIITDTEYNSKTVLEQRTYTEIEGSYIRNKNEVANWLKDHNERVILFGALHSVFDYLQEDQQSEKYKARFLEAIQELNAEEKRRRLSAGHSYTRFDANGLI